MKIMLNLNSARHRVGTPHTTTSTNERNSNGSIRNALGRRAKAVINNKSIDAETRAKVRYCLEIDDPWLAELVRRIEAGERIVDSVDLQAPDDSAGDAIGEQEGQEQEDKENPDEALAEKIEASVEKIETFSEKIETLAEMICQAGDEPAAALL